MLVDGKFKVRGEKHYRRSVSFRSLVFYIRYQGVSCYVRLPKFSRSYPMVELKKNRSRIRDTYFDSLYRKIWGNIKALSQYRRIIIIGWNQSCHDLIPKFKHPGFWVPPQSSSGRSNLKGSHFMTPCFFHFSNPFLICALRLIYKFIILFLEPYDTNHTHRRN